MLAVVSCQVVEVFNEGDMIWVHGFHLAILPAFLDRTVKVRCQIVHNDATRPCCTNLSTLRNINGCAVSNNKLGSVSMSVAKIPKRCILFHKGCTYILPLWREIGK